MPAVTPFAAVKSELFWIKIEKCVGEETPPQGWAKQVTAGTLAARQRLFHIVW